MKYSKLALYVSLVAIPALSHSTSIDLVQELTFTVPLLNRTIQNFDCKDSDRDSFVELLASDGLDVILYAPINDSILFHKRLDTIFLSNLGPRDSLPANLYSYRLAYGDVNRDTVPDICVLFASPFIFGYDTVLAIVMFDGISNFNNVKTAFGTSLRYAENIIGFQVNDFNNDGISELFISTMPYCINPFPFPWSSCGSSVLFHSFPDSISWEYTFPFKEVIPISLLNWDNYLLANQWYQIFSDAATSKFKTNGSVILLNSEGAIISGISYSTPDLCNASDLLYTRDVDVHSAQCLSLLTPESPYLDFVSTFSWSQSCLYYATPEPEVWDSSGIAMMLHRLATPDSSTIIWSRDLTGSSIEDFASHSAFPDFFFAILDDNLTVFNLADGLIAQQISPLPAGMIEWTYPFQRLEPRFTVVNDRTVTFYQLQTSTFVENDNGESLPTTFLLLNAYPNPFNSELNLYLLIPKKGQVTIEVFNIVGQRIDVLHDGMVSAGELNLKWNAGDSPSGVYLIKATGEEQVSTVKAVLLK